MTYEEIVNKLNANQTVPRSEVNEFQTFMLLRDRVITTLRSKQTLYEINFIPVEEEGDVVLFVTQDTHGTHDDALNKLGLIVDRYLKNENVYVQLEDELFQVIVEVLETE